MTKACAAAGLDPVCPINPSCLSTSDRFKCLNTGLTKQDCRSNWKDWAHNVSEQICPKHLSRKFSLQKRCPELQNIFWEVRRSSKNGALEIEDGNVKRGSRQTSKFNGQYFGLCAERISKSFQTQNSQCKRLILENNCLFRAAAARAVLPEQDGDHH